MLKPYIVQATQQDSLPAQLLERVDYAKLLATLRFPLIWVYEHYLQAWLPREVDSSFVEQLLSYQEATASERFERRLAKLSLHVEEQTTWEELKESMQRDGAVVVKRLFPLAFCELAADYYFRQPETHDRWPDMPGIKRTSVNNSPLMRLAHQSTERLARYVIGDIKTSYSFTSAYESGTILPKHTDRPQCVYNASVILASDPKAADLTAWPLYIEARTGLFNAKLCISDAVFYSGVRDPHWRDELPASINGVLGAFLHYVPSNFTGSLD